jgi:hypothetical protein
LSSCLAELEFGEDSTDGVTDRSRRRGFSLESDTCASGRAGIRIAELVGGLRAC